LSLRVRHGRWSLVLAYTLATVLVPSAHRHGEEADDAPTRCLASCQDARVHLSGHRAPDLDHLRLDCPACQFRASHQAMAILDPAPFRLTVVAAAPDLPPPHPRRTAALRPSCRAPPRV
jgi:hypothetical protein